MAAWRDMADDAYDRAEALGEALGLGWYCDDLEVELVAACTAASILCDAIDAVALEDERWGRGLPRAADMGASGPALTPDDAQAETPQGVAWSHPSRGITGDLGGPLPDLSFAPEGSAAGSSPARGHRRDDHSQGSAAIPEGAAAASRRFYPDVTEEAW